MEKTQTKNIFVIFKTNYHNKKTIKTRHYSDLAEHRQVVIHIMYRTNFSVLRSGPLSLL